MYEDQKPCENANVHSKRLEIILKKGQEIFINRILESIDSTFIRGRLNDGSWVTIKKLDEHTGKAKLYADTKKVIRVFETPSKKVVCFIRVLNFVEKIAIRKSWREGKRLFFPPLGKIFSHPGM